MNHAYAVLLSSEFQGFCRDLHSESVDALVAVITPKLLQPTLRSSFLFQRKLDKGNPNPGNIAEDFNRLGIRFKSEMDQLDRRNARRHVALEMMNRWRNAIAHQDFDPSRLGQRSALHLARVRQWRSICNALAQSYDNALYNYLHRVTGASPW